MTTRLDVMNRLGRAMADPSRSRILMTLLEGPSYPAVLARDLELTRSNVSNHLTCLRDCGIVVAEPEGRQTRYEISDPHLSAALTALVRTSLLLLPRSSTSPSRLTRMPHAWTPLAPSPAAVRSHHDRTGD